jgi:RNA polymerase sigma-70 factor (ECF subfamily)
MDEKLKIKQILEGDVNGFSCFVDTCQDMAVTIAYRICNNMQDAEDIVQESFIKAFHNLKTFKLDCKFSTWFYRIVYNAAITHVRSRFISSVPLDSAEIVEISADWDVIEKIDSEQKRHAVTHALSKLPPDASVILTLFYLEDNSVKDIVQITGQTEANVKVILHRGRKQLAGLLRAAVCNE